MHRSDRGSAGPIYPAAGDTVNRPDPAAPPVHAGLLLSGWVERRARCGALVLLLDFDGTLAPIVEDPDAAAMPEATRAALSRLTARGDTVLGIVSGRGLDDLRRRVGLRDALYAGNHGMEMAGAGWSWVDGEGAAARPALERVLRALGGPLRGIAGCRMEDKGLTLSVHLRQVASEQKEAVAAAVARAVGAHPGISVHAGKEVLEVRPARGRDKGDAVLALLARAGAPIDSPVVYVGDDRTDEDAFRVLGDRYDGSASGVRVGAVPQDTAATCYVRDPGEVCDLLTALDAGSTEG